MTIRLIPTARRFGRSEEGLSAVEYALMLALIAVTCMGIVTKLGHSNSKTYKQVKKVMVRRASGS
jgi:Flp pilus assembly pilin Flp